jgi:hypothetical protein
MLNRLMPNSVTIKRLPNVVGGKRSAPVVHLTNVPCTPLLPSDPEVLARVPNASPKELLQCFVPGTYDVREGDILIFDTREYPVRSAAEWALRTKSVNHLIIEDVKTV